jgi:hypothetical protein
MGLERTCAMLQGVDSNFHIDILRPLVEAVGDVCSKKYVAADDDGRRMRRIADHVRACTFAIHENVLPGNNEEKYVVKRLLRRAVLDGRQMGMKEPFLHKLPGMVASLMARPYPELAESVDRVATVIKREEESFMTTIDDGLQRIKTLFAGLGSSGRPTVGGADAADLYTTYGFPPELLETLAAERNIGFDWDGFRAAMDEHGKVSGAGNRVEVFTSGPLDALKKTMHGSEFLGYDTLSAEGKVLGIIARGQLCDALSADDSPAPVTIVLDRTPFYGESGGQVGDIGWLEWQGTDAGRFEVLDTQREGGFMLHVGHLRSGTLDLGATVSANVDEDRRAAIRRAHSATHLIHAALQHHSAQRVKGGRLHGRKCLFSARCGQRIVYQLDARYGAGVQVHIHQRVLIKHRHKAGSGGRTIFGCDQIFCVEEVVLRRPAGANRPVVRVIARQLQRIVQAVHRLNVVDGAGVLLPLNCGDINAKRLRLRLQPLHGWAGAVAGSGIVLARLHPCAQANQLRSQQQRQAPPARGGWDGECGQQRSQADADCKLQIGQRLGCTGGDSQPPPGTKPAEQQRGQHHSGLLRAPH